MVGLRQDGRRLDGLRLEGVRIPGVCRSLDLTVPPGTVRAAIVRDQVSVHSLANVVVGLTRPRQGRVLVDGVRVGQQDSDHRHHRQHRPSHRKRPFCLVRLVPAGGGLVPDLSVHTNIVNAQCPTAGMSRAEATDLVLAAASRLGIEEILDRAPEHLSAAQRRLAGLALALCWEPSVVVLEDAAGLPTWDTVAESVAPSALSPVAVLVITTDAARVWRLDDDPVGVEPGGTR